MRLGGVNRQRAADFAEEPDRQGRNAAEPVRGGGGVPRRRTRVAQKVVDDDGLALADARADRTAAFRAVVGIDFDFVQITGLVSAPGNGVDSVSLGVSQADPDQLEARLLGNDPADFAE